MKIKVKSWEDIKKTLREEGWHNKGGRFHSDMKILCDSIFEVDPVESPCFSVRIADTEEVPLWRLHEDWYDVIEEEEPKAKEKAMKVKIKSWEDIKISLDKTRVEGVCFPSTAKPLCGRTLEVTFPVLKGYDASIKSTGIHLCKDWYDVVEEDETKEPEVKEKTMKIRIKSWEDIKKTLNSGRWYDDSAYFSAYFNDCMKKYCGKEIEATPSQRLQDCAVAHSWIWHPDWYDVIEEEEEPKAKEKTMKVKIKSWEEIEKTLDGKHYHKDGNYYHKDGIFFVAEMQQGACGKVYVANPTDLEPPCVLAGRWVWHPDWYDVVEEEPKEPSKVPDYDLALQLCEKVCENKSVYTEWYKEARRRIRRECYSSYDIIFNDFVLAEPGEGSSALSKLVDNAVSTLFNLEDTTPEHIYGLTAHVAFELDNDEDWPGKLWGLITQCWESQLQKQEIETKEPSNLNKDDAVKGTMGEIKTTLPICPSAGNLEKQPSTLRICGQDVELRIEDPGLWTEGTIGINSTANGRILLSSNCPEAVQESTLVHEVTHYILDCLSIEMDEQGVSSFAVSLHSFIQDNPDQIKKIMSRK